MIEDFFKRLRGVFGNALVWGSAWFVVGIALTAVFFPSGIGRVPFWPVAMAVARELGGLGLFAGGGFSLFLVMFGRNRPLNELRPGWVALGTCITVGLFIPALGAFYGAAMFSSAISVGGVAGVLAGVTALGQIKIVQKALTSGEESQEELGTGPERLLREAKAE